MVKNFLLSVVCFLTLSVVPCCAEECDELVVLTAENVTANSLATSSYLFLGGYRDNILVNSKIIVVPKYAKMEYEYTADEDFLPAEDKIDTIKVFRWEDMNEQKPLCESRSISIPIYDENRIIEYYLLEDNTYAVKAGINAETQTEIIIPETFNGRMVSRIMSYGFSELSTLKSVTIPKTVTFIGEYAFYNSGLTIAILEDATGWKLENEVKNLGKDYGVNCALKTTNFSTKRTETNGSYVTVSILLSNNWDYVASLLSRKTDFEIKEYNYSLGRYEESSRNGSANFYTENWIKE